MSADAIAKNLAAWYAGEKERYDFRHDRNPYRTWITEIFLQQTQIAAGTKKLKVFLKRFPDAKALARGPIEDVLAAFQGMGYYSRARNMHRAALEIVERHKGIVPVNYDALMKISGIGHYTAALIASIHDGEKILALDANHARVLSRLFKIDHQQGSSQFKKAAAKAAARFFENKMSAGDVNEALMQWGQLICKRTPLCTQCFASAYCAAYNGAQQHAYPVKAARAESLELLWIMFVCRKGNKYQVFQNSGKFPFLKGEWMFPGVFAPISGSIAVLPETLSATFLKKAAQKTQSLPVDFKHAITRYKISIKLLISNEPIAGGKFFTPHELREKCHSSLMQKALRRLDKLEFE